MFPVLNPTQSGVGKSSLINCVFDVDDAKVSDFNPGDADIDKEITSERNKLFVLHDSKGFEPADLTTFNVVHDFIIRRSNDQLELKDRLHAAWLCIKTPFAGGRVLEAGDEKFLQLAQEYKVPVVVVFTKYDILVRKPGYTEDKSKAEFMGYVKSLETAADRLGIKMPPYINVTVPKPGKRAGINISKLVEITREVVKEYLTDAWIMWVVAQRAHIPKKVELCIEKGMHYYQLALGGALPAFGKSLLRECLFLSHKDIIASWGFRDPDAVLTSANFRHLMLSIVQEMPERCRNTSLEALSSSPPDVARIHEFVGLCTVASASVAPPVAILGLTYIFLKWMADIIVNNTPDVQRVFIAYTVDLILVLDRLFDFVMRPKVMGSVSWTELRNAFEAYHDSKSQRSVHDKIRALVEMRGKLSLESDVRPSVEDLVKEFSESM
ncbi:hypothetical protein DFH08DRAFT_1014892 [Mycena albidolilacea]|uniref:G domain-containing protein n=1 Tax=Mycena albidolilacea TaxID=1033008 RepID=A0AAD7ENK9_9AGAR|nr:hypothetical protein DFH08DRAFT_1014892 [Mycena albidolilacea]